MDLLITHIISKYSRRRQTNKQNLYERPDSNIYMRDFKGLWGTILPVLSLASSWKQYRTIQDLNSLFTLEPISKSLAKARGVIVIREYIFSSSRLTDMEAAKHVRLEIVTLRSEKKKRCYNKINKNNCEGEPTDLVSKAESLYMCLQFNETWFEILEIALF